MAADRSVPGSLELGAFSVSLNVADLGRSRTFYEALGFEIGGGDVDSGYLIMKNGQTMIGLFHEMFERNVLTFNPGLTNRMERLESFTDVREIQSELRSRNIEPTSPVDADAAQGPASLMLIDPDGNPILIDQFF